MPQAPPKFDVCDHIEWCRIVASRMAFALGAHGAAKDDAVGVALLTMIRLAPKFDPSRVPAGGDAGGQFRGWAHPHIRGEVQREVVRLRNGGTFNTTGSKAAKRMCVAGLPIGPAGDGSGNLEAAGTHLETDGRRSPTPSPLALAVEAEESRLERDWLLTGEQP